MKDPKGSCFNDENGSVLLTSYITATCLGLVGITDGLGSALRGKGPYITQKGTASRIGDGVRRTLRGSYIVLEASQMVRQKPLGLLPLLTMQRPN